MYALIAEVASVVQHPSAGRSRRSLYGVRPNSRTRYASAYPAQMATLNAAPPATDDAIGWSSRDNVRAAIGRIARNINASPTGMNNAQKDPIIAFALPYFHHPARKAKYS